jgi:hypothetical protein
MMMTLLGGPFVLADAPKAFAGWMGFRNDTPDVLVIQETVVVNGQSRPGRAHRLAAGEAVRDTQVNGGQKLISIFDPRQPAQPVYSSVFACPAGNENLLYLIKSGRNGIAIEPVRTPAHPSKK